MNRHKQFNQTLAEIKAVYSTPSNARRIYYEFISDYRRIVVLESGKGFEIRTDYKGFASEFIKTWSTYWGTKELAMAWAKCYSDNRYIVCGNLTIKEKQGKQII